MTVGHHRMVVFDVVHEIGYWCIASTLPTSPLFGYTVHVHFLAVITVAWLQSCHLRCLVTSSRFYDCNHRCLVCIERNILTPEWQQSHSQLLAQYCPWIFRGPIGSSWKYEEEKHEHITVSQITKSNPCFNYSPFYLFIDLFQLMCYETLRILF